MCAVGDIFSNRLVLVRYFFVSFVGFNYLSLPLYCSLWVVPCSLSSWMVTRKGSRQISSHVKAMFC